MHMITTPRRARFTRPGLMLVDLLMAIVVLGIILAAVVPTMRPEDQMRLIGASSILASDIEYAQSATLSNPSDPTIVRFDDDQARYWLARESAPDTPIPRPSGTAEPYEVFMGNAADTVARGVSIDASQLTDLTIAFNDIGAIDLESDPVVRLTNSTGAIQIRVRAATGSVLIEDTP